VDESDYVLSTDEKTGIQTRAAAGTSAPRPARADDGGSSTSMSGAAGNRLFPFTPRFTPVGNRCHPRLEIVF
jgi:hypothetical protein